MFSEVLSPLKHELKSWNDNLSHIHPKSMFRIEKLESSHKDLYTWRMMCLFVHHACLEQKWEGNGEQKGKNQVP